MNADHVAGYVLIGWALLSVAAVAIYIIMTGRRDELLADRARLLRKVEALEGRYRVELQHNRDVKTALARFGPGEALDYVDATDLERATCIEDIDWDAS